MPDIIDANGLQTATHSELLTQLKTDLQAIYGSDIDLSPNSPDGQALNIFVQSALDVRDLLVQVNAQFDPDQSVGVTLDQRITLNGIQRQAGTFSQTPVAITVNTGVTLTGLNDSSTNPYTVADAAGNQWHLVTTQNPVAAGTYAYTFQAATPGARTVTANTITVPVTVVLGVTGINNPDTTGTVVGVTEELDATVKVRRKKSVSIGSQGYLAALYAALANVTGVTAAYIYENDTDGSDGVISTGHSIWVIVDGSPADADVANAIYLKRNAGCNMKGVKTHTITQVDGSPFVVKWDSVATENLYMQLHVTNLDGTPYTNGTALKAGIVDILSGTVPTTITGVNAQFAAELALGPNGSININDLSTIAQLVDPNVLIVPTAGDGFSLTAGSYANVLAPSAKNKKFVADTTRISLL